MLRAAIFAACATWFASGALANACIVSDGFSGIIYGDIPADAAPDAIVLNVEFSERTIREPRRYGDVATARVQRVIRGHFDGTTVGVGLGGSSCDYPFIYGGRGLIIGHIFTPAEGQARSDGINHETNEQTRLQFMWPYQETVFIPMTEAVAERRTRTGHVRVRRPPE
jgi:hypothetical protein